MTPEEFKEAMEKIHNDCVYDNEVAHGLADDLMCQVLTTLGYGDGIAVFNELEKWYA